MRAPGLTPPTFIRLSETCAPSQSHHNAGFETTAMRDARGGLMTFFHPECMALGLQARCRAGK
jgi:hypothetical protein